MFENFIVCKKERNNIFTAKYRGHVKVNRWSDGWMRLQ